MARMEPGDTLGQEQATLRALALGRLAGQREHMGMTQAELAECTGLSRMTIQRLESHGADTTLSTFIAYATGVGLFPELSESQEATRAGATVHRPAPTTDTRDWRERGRAQAFALGWEAMQKGQDGVARALLPELSQSQATAMSTAIGWLGTNSGVEFLREVLSAQGYELTDCVQDIGAALPRQRAAQSA